MTDDRSLERAARSWLEEGPTSAPDRPVETALARIQTTPQERDLRIPWVAWRPRTMFGRLAVAAVAAVVAIGTFTLGASLLTTPDNAAGPCPATFDEADAIDTFAPGLLPAQRAWGIDGGTPGRVRPGVIAAFALDASAPLSVITIDPATGAQCRLVRFMEDKPVRNDVTPLDWSPSGDALAMGIENPQPPEGDPTGQTGQILIWTPSRLLRVWAGEGQIPSFEWAPDGRSIAVWKTKGGPDTGARIIFADGSPDRIFGIQPFAGEWSPDGSRWIVAEGFRRSTVAVVDLVDGRMTPIDLGIDFLSPVGWIDNERVLLRGTHDRSVVGYLDVPVASPESYSVVQVPEDAFPDSFVAFSPNLRRVAYVDTDGDVGIADIASGSSGTPVHIDADGTGTFGLAWAPDGSQVVFRTNPPDNTTWVVNADGTELRQIAVGSTWVNGDPWQPVPVQ